MLISISSSIIMVSAIQNTSPPIDASAVSFDTYAS